MGEMFAMRVSAGRVSHFRALLLTSIAGSALICSTTKVLAQSVPLETVTITAEVNLNTASGVAPTLTPLDAIQPTSIINQNFIEKNEPLSTNYDEIIKHSPSVFDTAPNGPGLAESQNITIRGFQDGFFNVTFDGIPWNDSNDFTHHSTSYFMAHDYGQVTIDRGPGTAATIGNATFGGTVGILSKAPSNDGFVNPYVMYGSFNTVGYGTELDSGTLASDNGARFLFDLEGLNSAGYLTHMGQDRQNVFFKAIQPLDGNTTLTVVGMYNHIHQGISLGATAAQIAQFGPNWALSADPTQQNFYGYNFDQITDDFEYADLASTFDGGWSLDTKVYTYGYYHRGFNGEDPNGEFANGTSENPNGVPGQRLTNDYRSVGTITRLVKTFSFGDVRTGIWYDRQVNSRALYEIDISDPTKPINLDPDTGVPNGIDRLLHQTLQTLQPYFQVDWVPIDGLTLSPGVRYSYFDRNVNADVNVKSGLPQAYNNAFSATLPSFSANYAISQNWSAYAQVAEGFLAPNENFFNFQSPNTTNVSPQQSWNYQAGTAVQLPNVTASLDVYYIDFSNLIGSRTVGGQTVFFNQGGVTYEGVETEDTYLLGGGFSIYVSGSINSAKDRATHLWIANAPDYTASLGPIYNDDGFYVSLIGQWIGDRYGDVGQTQRLQPFFEMDGAASYDLMHINDQLKDLTLTVQVMNLTNVTKIINLAGYTVQDSTPLYWTMPGRSVFVSLSAKL
jgi:iron complex outermembrane recepter protein